MFVVRKQHESNIRMYIWHVCISWRFIPVRKEKQSPFLLLKQIRMIYCTLQRLINPIRADFLFRIMKNYVDRSYFIDYCHKLNKDHRNRAACWKRIKWHGVEGRERKMCFNRNLLFQYITNVTCEKEWSPRFGKSRSKYYVHEDSL